MSSEGAAHTIQRLERELMAERMENDKLRARLKEHEQFRRQHRGCDRMGVALQQIGRLVKDVQSPFPTSGSQP
jgi:predicted RNase H-like nuclease (RuvC/YqgF family)